MGNGQQGQIFIAEPTRSLPLCSFGVVTGLVMPLCYRDLRSRDLWVCMGCEL